MHGKGCTKSFYTFKFDLQGHFQGQIAIFSFFDLEILCLTLRMTLNLKSSGTKMMTISHIILSDRKKINIRQGEKKMYLILKWRPFWIYDEISRFLHFKENSCS